MTNPRATHLQNGFCENYYSCQKLKIPEHFRRQEVFCSLSGALIETGDWKSQTLSAQAI